MKMIDKIILEQFYLNRPCRFYSKYAPEIRSERTGLLTVEVYENNEEYEIQDVAISERSK